MRLADAILEALARGHRVEFWQYGDTIVTRAAAVEPRGDYETEHKVDERGRLSLVRSNDVDNALALALLDLVEGLPR